MTEQKILIAGAGIGGLAAALSLLQKGFPVEIYEQASELREVGAGLWLSMNGARVLFDLGLEEELRAAAIAADRRCIRHWSSGFQYDFFVKGEHAEVNQPFVLLRAHLLKMLVNAVERLQPGAIRLNTRCLGFEQDAGGVTLKLDGGATARGAALLGADGVHSRIRDAMLGPVPSRYTQAIAWRGLTPMNRLSPHQRQHVVASWIAPKGHFTIYPVRWQDVDLLTFSGQIETTEWAGESWSEKGSVEDCLKDCAGWHPDIMEMVSQVESLHKWGLFVREPLPRWTEGRVTLMGDACHSMVPYLGQGVNMAIEDGEVLARCLAATPDDVPAALARYEAARRPRTTAVAEAAMAMRGVFHNPRAAEAGEGADYIRETWAPGASSRRFDWLYHYDALTVPLPEAEGMPQHA